MSFIPTAKGFLNNMDLFVAQPPVNHSLTLKPPHHKNNSFHATQVIPALFLVYFFMLLYCYCVSKPHHFDTVLYLINVVTKLLYPNCTQNSI